MTAELLGFLGAFSAVVKALAAEMCECWLHPVPARHAVFHVNEPRPARRRQNGFTFVEMMTASSVAGVVSLLMAPTVMAMIETHRVKTTTFELYVALAHARSEAIKRNAVVSVAAMPVSDRVSIKGPRDAGVAYNQYGQLTVAAPYYIEVSSTRVRSIPKRCVVFDPYGHPIVRVDENHDGDCTNG